MEDRIRDNLPARPDGLPWKVWIPGAAQPIDVIEGSIYLKIPRWVEEDLWTLDVKKREEIGSNIIQSQLETYKEIWDLRNEELVRRGWTFEELKSAHIDDQRDRDDKEDFENIVDWREQEESRGRRRTRDTETRSTERHSPVRKRQKLAPPTTARLFFEELLTLVTVGKWQ